MSKYLLMVAVGFDWTLLVLSLCAFLVGTIVSGLVLFFWLVRSSDKRYSAECPSIEATIASSPAQAQPSENEQKSTLLPPEQTAARHQSEEQFRAIFEQSEIGINLADLTGRFIWVNSAFCKLVGYSQEELLQKTFVDLTYPIDRNSETALIAQLLKNNIPTYSLEKRYVCKDGRLKWVNIHVTLVKDEKGETVLSSAIAEDINERKRIEDERKQAAEALRRGEERFRVIFEQAAVGIVEADLSGAYLKVNQWFCEFIGYSSTELLTMSFQQVTHPDDLAISRQYGKQLFEGLCPYFSLEKRFIRKDGQVLWANVSVSLVTKSDGSADYTIAVIEDITERKQAQAALEHSEREMQAMFNSMTDVVFMLDRQGRYLKSATASNHLLRQPVGDFPGKTVYDVFEPEQADKLIRIIGQALEAKTTIKVEYSLDINGQEVWFSTHVSPVSENSVVWVARDISQRRQAEEALKQQAARDQELNARLEQLVEERTAVLQKALDFEAMLKRITDKVRDSLDENQILQTAVSELGIGLAVEACNAANYSSDLTSNKITHEYFTHKALGLGQETIFSEFPTPTIFDQLLRGDYFQFCFSIESAVSLNEEFYAVLACPIFDNEGLLGDLWLFKQKHEIFNELEVRIVQQVANQCAIALRQSRLYQAAQAQVQELERLNQLKDDFLSTVSHELRTPMSNIKLSVEMLQISMQKMGLLNQEGERIPYYLKILREECQRETNLINDLLDLSRLDAGTDPLMTTRLNLQYWLPHLVEVFAERMREAQHQLIIEIPEDLPPLETDFNYLEMVLMELIHNACKYTSRGESILIGAKTLVVIPEIIAEIQPKAAFVKNASPSSPLIEIRVANSGTEIPPQELPHVFEKFYRVPNNDPWKHGGTGLGLALVKKRVERLGGTIAVTSQNNWTTFIVCLPNKIKY